jgi:RNA polymerase sigma factor (sigma-70 family)
MQTVLPPGSVFLSESITRRIHFRAKRLRRKFGLSREAEMDLRQDFWISLVRAAPRFDAKRCTPDRYAKMILNSRYKDYVRTRTRVRKVAAPDVMSMEDVDPNIVSLLVDPAAEMAMENVGTAMDVQSVVETLTPEDRRICHAVMTSASPTEAARHLGISHTSVRRSLKRLRPIFAAMKVSPIS